MYICNLLYFVEDCKQKGSRLHLITKGKIILDSTDKLQKVKFENIIIHEACCKELFDSDIFYIGNLKLKRKWNNKY